MKQTKKIALVTGANKGLGFETAKQLLEQNIEVLLGVRNEVAGKDAQENLRTLGLDSQIAIIDVSDEGFYR